ncbi:hypothetical protein ABLN73_04760, partial [Mycobacterium tuberculosis]
SAAFAFGYLESWVFSGRSPTASCFRIYRETLSRFSCARFQRAAQKTAAARWYVERPLPIRSSRNAPSGRRDVAVDGAGRGRRGRVMEKRPYRTPRRARRWPGNLRCHLDAQATAGEVAARASADGSANGRDASVVFSSVGWAEL